MSGAEKFRLSIEENQIKFCLCLLGHAELIQKNYTFNIENLETTCIKKVTFPPIANGITTFTILALNSCSILILLYVCVEDVLVGRRGVSSNNRNLFFHGSGG